MQFLAVLWVLLFASLGEAAPFYDCIEPSSTLEYVFRQSCEGKDRDYLGREDAIRTNSLRIRAPEPDALPKGLKRILFFAPAMGIEAGGRMGIPSSLEKELNAGKQKYVVINASMPGYRLVHEYLRLPELLAAYQPDLVVVFHGLQSPALAQAADHLFADKGENGLATSLGDYPAFWPIPLFLEGRLRSLLGKHAYGVDNFCQGVRLSLVKLAVRMGFFKGEEGYSFYVWNQLRYLRALRDLSQKSGAKFFVVNREKLEEDPAVHFGRVKSLAEPIRPDFRANRWLTWPHLTPVDLPAYRDALEREFSYVHARKVMNPDVWLFEKDGQTPTEGGAKEFGKAIAGGIRKLE